MSNYEVLYSPSYGSYGISFPEEFLKEVFRRYPPESEEGKTLWTPHSYTNEVVKTEDFCHGYKWVYYRSWSNTLYTNNCTKDFKTFYAVNNSDSEKWRTLPIILAMAKEWKLHETCLSIQKIPIHYDFHVQEYDGFESVKAICPKDRLIEDLLRIVNTGTREHLHPLTQRLLDGCTYEEIKTPPKLDNADYADDSDHE